MEHIDSDTIALLALGEDLASEAQRTHLDQCAQCRTDLEAMQRVTGLARESDAMQRPDDRVWEAVSRELDLDGATEAASPEPASSEPVVAAPTGPERTPARSSRRGPRLPWWRRRLAWALAAVLVIGAGVGVLVDRTLVRSGERAEVIATADLEPLPEFPDIEPGAAQLHRSESGYVLTVELDADAQEGFREVWLIHTDLQQLVSVGVLVGTSGSFDLPAGLDLDGYAIVDVSDEPFDGDPAHSGVSLVRGELSS